MVFRSICRTVCFKKSALRSVFPPIFFKVGWCPKSAVKIKRNLVPPYNFFFNPSIFKAHAFHKPFLMNDHKKVFTFFNKAGRHIYQARMKLAQYTNCLRFLLKIHKSFLMNDQESSSRFLNTYKRNFFLMKDQKNGHHSYQAKMKWALCKLSTFCSMQIVYLFLHKFGPILLDGDCPVYGPVLVFVVYCLLSHQTNSTVGSG